LQKLKKQQLQIKLRPEKPDYTFSIRLLFFYTPALVPLELQEKQQVVIEKQFEFRDFLKTQPHIKH